MLTPETAGPSHPLSFDPEVYKLAGINQRAALLPDSTHIVRWYNQPDLATAHETIATKNRHFAAIAKIGEIAVPEQIDFIGEIPLTDARDVTAIGNMVAIYTIVPYYNRIRRITAKEDAHKIATTLRGYNEWLNDNNEPKMLYDIFALRQYGITEQGITLLDIEPHMFSRLTKSGEPTPASRYHTQDLTDQLEVYFD